MIYSNKSGEYPTIKNKNVKSGRFLYPASLLLFYLVIPAWMTVKQLIYFLPIESRALRIETYWGSRSRKTP